MFLPAAKPRASKACVLDVPFELGPVCLTNFKMISPHLSKLGDDVLIFILSFLRPHDIVVLRQVRLSLGKIADCSWTVVTFLVILLDVQRSFNNL